MVRIAICFVSDFRPPRRHQGLLPWPLGPPQRSAFVFSDRLPQEGAGVYVYVCSLMNGTMLRHPSQLAFSSRKAVVEAVGCHRAGIRPVPLRCLEFRRKDASRFTSPFPCCWVSPFARAALLLQTAERSPPCPCPLCGWRAPPKAGSQGEPPGAVSAIHGCGHAA